MTYEDEGFNRRERAYDEMPESDCANCFNAWPVSDLDAETQRCPNCRMRDPDWQEEPCDRKALSAKVRREATPTLKSVRKEREPALADLRREREW